MTTSETIQRLSDAQLDELLTLTKGTDSVELKLTVPDSNLRSTVVTLGMDALQAQIRQVYFFDTPTLMLNQKGIVVRARRIQGRDADAVVKLRPVVPSELPARLRKSPNLTVEVDAMPGGFVCSASLKETVADATVRAGVSGVASLKKLYSKEQRAFLAAHAPVDVSLNDLAVLGPIFVLKLRFKPKGFGRKMVAELWNYPDGSRVVELSTKCLPSEAFQVAAEARAFLSKRGLDLSAEQATKTKIALEFYSRSLTETAA